MEFHCVHRAGARVLVNGREIARAHLPAGSLGAESAADDYPLEAYVARKEEIPAGKVYHDGLGDLDRTMRYAVMGGQDSDCNPSSAGGVMFTTVGLSKLPDKFTSALNKSGKFSTTPYDYPALVAVCEKLARAAVVRAGGRGGAVEPAPERA